MAARLPGADRPVRRRAGQPRAGRPLSVPATAGDEGYGGLEHRASTSLYRQARRPAATGRDRRQRRLSVAAWSRQPRVFPHLERQAHQAGGFRALRPDRARITRDSCGPSKASRPTTTTRAGTQRRHQRRRLSGARRAPDQRTAAHSGRTTQSVAESSFDAWIKYYRQDENSPNAIVSYYVKGALVALALDLTLRREAASRSTTSCARCGSAMASPALACLKTASRRSRARLPGIDLGAFFARLRPWHCRVAAAVAAATDGYRARTLRPVARRKGQRRQAGDDPAPAVWLGRDHGRRRRIARQAS